jgi:DNA-binding protein HU-beta
MKKRDLAAAVANHVDVDPKVAAKVLDGTIEVILATVAKGEDVTLTGFAKLSKVKRAARVGRNPQTGEPVKIKAKTVAKITPLKGFKDVVLGVNPAPKIAAAKKAAPAAKQPAPAAKKAPAVTRGTSRFAAIRDAAPAASATPAKARGTTATTAKKRATTRTTSPTKKKAAGAAKKV